MTGAQHSNRQIRETLARRANPGAQWTDPVPSDTPAAGEARSPLVLGAANLIAALSAAEDRLQAGEFAAAVIQDQTPAAVNPPVDTLERAVEQARAADPTWDLAVVIGRDQHGALSVYDDQGLLIHRQLAR